MYEHQWIRRQSQCMNGHSHICLNIGVHAVVKEEV